MDTDITTSSADVGTEIVISEPPQLSNVQIQETIPIENKILNSDLNIEIIPNIESSKNVKIQSNQNDNFIQKYFRKKTKGLTKRQILICVIFAFVEFFAATVISIQAPFFPDVASSKGATAIEYGFVFGVFELTVFIMSPIFGAKMNFFGPKRLFNWGIFVTGSCCVIFGFLNFIQGRVPFIVSCFIFRIIEAIGDSAFVVASFTIISIEFPESIAATFGTMETFYGLGMIAGPTIGGALYEAGGYTLPFVLMGGLLFASAAATYFLLPEIGENVALEQKSNGSGTMVTTSGFEMFKMLRFPVIFMVAYSIVATANGVGFLHSTLEPHLDIAHSDLNKFFVGTIFILNGGVYALTAPKWGNICDKSEQPKYFTAIGSAFTISGFLLIGPVPFLPWNPNLWSICIGLILFGLGLGATLVSAFIQTLQDAIKLGYPDDVSTYGLVSGLWTSMTALGFFIGSSMGGILSYSVGVRYGTFFVLAGQVILVLMLIAYFYKQKKLNNSGPVTEKIDFDIVMKLPNVNEMNGITVISSDTTTAIINPCFEDDSKAI